MTARVEHDAGPETPTSPTVEPLASSPVLEMLGDPVGGVCVDGVCEAPGPSPVEPTSAGADAAVDPS